ncbi:hypothetical protein [Dechloromonas sp. CZR5]|uniref:hypothetical protein n=1 Tax=Dechloromonas sp. CZR5 TaxID=2608630 RepID=UPI00123D466D|nr:hypothetical protein [Dechloromonas sp. CZR5]
MTAVGHLPDGYPEKTPENNKENGTTFQKSLEFPGDCMYATTLLGLISMLYFKGYDDFSTACAFSIILLLLAELKAISMRNDLDAPEWLHILSKVFWHLREAARLRVAVNGVGAKTALETSAQDNLADPATFEVRPVVRPNDTVWITAYAELTKPTVV